MKDALLGFVGNLFAMLAVVLNSEFLFFSMAMITSLIGAYFIAGAVDKKLLNSKKWKRITSSLVALVFSFTVILSILVAIIYFTMPDEGFSR